MRTPPAAISNASKDMVGPEGGVFWRGNGDCSSTRSLAREVSWRSRIETNNKRERWEHWIKYYWGVYCEYGGLLDGC